jgi:hypothetical protein
MVHLDGVIDHEIDGHERLHPRDVTASSDHCRPHRRQIDEKRDTGEILEQDAPDDEGDLRRPLCVRLPARQRFDVLVSDAPAVEIAQHGFEQDAKAHREPRDSR